MRWRRVLKNLVRTAGVLGQELISTYRELIKSIRSIDKLGYRIRDKLLGS